MTARIIEACYHVHNHLGPGFVERIYRNALGMSLERAGLKVITEKEYTVFFEGNNVGKFRADLVVEEKVILELKAVEGRMPKIFESQLISYLKASGLKVGLLINFGNRSCEIRRLMF
ncbi:MAG: GxxExxY protein [Thermodesulfobacteriota bacterium]